VLGDLRQHGDMFVAARGGAGGHGNRFYLSNENRAPMVYEEGARGQERMLQVELRIMAHAGLVSEMHNQYSYTTAKS
jgi:GTP-binding protein